MGEDKSISEMSNKEQKEFKKLRLYEITAKCDSHEEFSITCVMELGFKYMFPLNKFYIYYKKKESSKFRKRFGIIENIFQFLQLSLPWIFISLTKSPVPISIKLIWASVYFPILFVYLWFTIMNYKTNRIKDIVEAITIRNKYTTYIVNQNYTTTPASLLSSCVVIK